jgi:RNA polymerase sigma-70 factor (sigma-B/F/G subfamily)
MSPVLDSTTHARHEAPTPHHLASADTSERPADDRGARTLQLLRRAQDADPEGRRDLLNQVVVLNLSIAESIVSRYRNRGVPTDDLVQVASMGLVKAARGFDPAKSESFLGYAIPTILGEVKRYFRDNAWTVKPPRRIQELQSEVSAARARMTSVTGEAPGVMTLARELDVPPADVVDALTADGCFSPTSLDRTHQTTDETGSTLGDLVGADDPRFDRIEALVALAPACQDLSVRDRRIIYLRFFREWTQARIAEEFGVTQMQVSRLLTRILCELRTAIGEFDATSAGRMTTRTAARAG